MYLSVVNIVSRCLSLCHSGE